MLWFRAGCPPKASRAQRWDFGKGLGFGGSLSLRRWGLAGASYTEDVKNHVPHEEKVSMTKMNYRNSMEKGYL